MQSSPYKANCAYSGLAGATLQGLSEGQQRGDRTSDFSLKRLFQTRLYPLQTGVLDTNMLKTHLEELLSFTDSLVAILFTDIFQSTDNPPSKYFCYAGHAVFESLSFNELYKPGEKLGRDPPHSRYQTSPVCVIFAGLCS